MWGKPVLRLLGNRKGVWGFNQQNPWGFLTVCCLGQTVPSYSSLSPQHPARSPVCGRPSINACGMTSPGAWPAPPGGVVSASAMAIQVAVLIGQHIPEEPPITSHLCLASKVIWVSGYKQWGYCRHELTGALGGSGVGRGAEWDQPEIPALPAPQFLHVHHVPLAPQAEGSHASSGCGPERPCTREKWALRVGRVLHGLSSSCALC